MEQRDASPEVFTTTPAVLTSLPGHRPPALPPCLQSLIDLKDRFTRLVDDAFTGDRDFHRALKEAFENVMNNPDLSAAAAAASGDGSSGGGPISPNVCAEYLSVYTDEMMKVGFKGLDGASVEDTLDKVRLPSRHRRYPPRGPAYLSNAVIASSAPFAGNPAPPRILLPPFLRYAPSLPVPSQVITLFRFLSDKDVFEAHYKLHLQRRLLSGRSTSEEAEAAMLSRLKHECGFQYTSKLEGMFNDLRTSADFMVREKSDEPLQMPKEAPVSAGESCM